MYLLPKDEIEEKEVHACKVDKNLVIYFRKQEGFFFPLGICIFLPRCTTYLDIYYYSIALVPGVDILSFVFAWAIISFCGWLRGAEQKE